MAKAVFSDTDKVNMRWFWKNYIREKSLWLILIMVLIILQGFVYQQFLVYTEDGLRVIFDGGNFLDLIKICGFVIVAFGFRAIISYVVPVISARIAGDAILKLRGHLTEKVMHLRQEYFDRNSSSELILRMVNQVDGLSQFVGQTSVNAVRDSFTIIIVSCYLIYKSPLLFLAALIVLPAIFLILKFVSDAIKQIRKSAENALAAYINSIDEMTSGVRTIKMSNQEETEVRRMYGASSGIKQLSIELQKTQSLVLPAIDLSSAFVFVLVIGGGGYMVLSDEYGLDSASIIAFILGLVIIFDPARSLSQFFTRMQSSLVLLESIKSLLDTQDEKTNDFNRPAFFAEDIQIKVNKISFSYLNDALFFEKISMEFKPGQKTAIVGSTGSGKTTILSLITMLYEVTGGNITFNGQDSREFSRSSIRSHFSIVAQDIVIFNSSIYENIRYANPAASIEEIKSAAKRAHIFTLMQERGDLPVGPKGSQLSGGQKQRIAIARAFLRPAPILVLDEATSALDALTEKSVNTSLFELQKDKTTIVVTHKLSSVLDADKIYVLDSGKLVEEGTHEKLMQKDSLYKSMFNVQLNESL